MSEPTPPPRSPTAPPAAFVPAEYEWLLLRFDADAAARDAALFERVSAAVAGHSPLRVLDLGAGAGANLLHLAPRLPASVQHWTAVDRDAALVGRMAAGLEHMSEHLRARGDEVECHGRSLRFGDRRVRYRTLTGDFLDPDDAIYHESWDLVVANAVFDLLSAAQFARFLELAKQRWCERLPPMYFTINLDIGLAFEPAHPLDDAVRAHFHAHMQRPQYFGRALGADCARELVRIAEDAGMVVETGASPWRIGAEERAALRANFDFFDSAVRELIAAGSASLAPEDFARWLDERRAQIDAGELSLTVEHQDLWCRFPA
ncbi:class I SAM-dependent methyltransferase [Haliangium ochraceum]|uniref:Methyltransferase type 12 n=1 Tax=Haliangium ochraceum (strain DSM 14365 / JCM 11303 / SMP-2) TaxID=502025 RepID=D0LZN9_HALO1|nr:class I SAM-dependent methyltransferase [Haliangium ochraceum]ACY18018.1 conserved hypothetical protein [Haliangium ochraceum DSM 14365]